MYLENINKETANLYKGAGILLIVLHNYFHNVPPIIGENEFLFQQAVTDRLIAVIQDSPTEWVRAVFTYLGHYGVQLFIFLSAYGLTRRYASAPLSYKQFLRSRFAKIYLSFVICVAAYIVLGLLKSAFLTDEKVIYWDSLLWKLLLVSNFVPGQALMPVGPWWFMPFIFHFYLIFPLLLLAYKYTGIILLILLSGASLVLEWQLNPALVANGFNMNYMVFGHFPVLCYGIYVGSNTHISIPAWVSFAALAVFVSGCFSSILWLLSDLSALILLLVVLDWCFGKIAEEGIIYRFIGFYGTLSFFLFMVNGFLRSPFHNLAVSQNAWWFTIICGISSLLFSSLFAVVLKETDQKLRYLASR